MAREITDGYAITAAVCLSRHHRSPTVVTVESDSGLVLQYQVAWPPPTAEHIRSSANVEQATRDGAYALALAAVDAQLGLVALRRAEGRSGSDFYLIPKGSDVPSDPHLDLERDDLIRLEVSGINEDDDAAMRGRVRQKIRQALDGHSPVPAIVGVVGFLSARVVFREARG
jgi:hypothetical protein